MPAPNMNAPTKVEGKTVVSALTTSSASVLSNAAASGKLLRVVAVTLVNIDGTNACDVNLWHSVGGADSLIASTIAVPADANFVPIGRDNPLYLEEGASLKAAASANGDLNIMISYEEIS